MPEIVCIGNELLSIENFINVSRHGAKVRIESEAKDRVIANCQALNSLIAAGRLVYGANTGVGEEADKRIPISDLRTKQEALLLSHATGVGPMLAEPIVRGMMLLRINTLTKAHSGVRPILLEYLSEFLNRNIYPYVPAKGSVGASGDLAPSAHIALLLVGKGSAWLNNNLLAGKEILKQLQMEPLLLEGKEGLALINGTDMMSAIGTLAVYDTEILLKTADIIASMSFDALRGKTEAFRSDVHTLRPHNGQISVAANLLEVLRDSQLVSIPTDMIQDAYSLRCIPQVHGASRDAFAYVKKTIETEINSVTDNPLIFTEPAEAVCAGHFHGQPVAIAMDVLSIALAEIANLSERRVHRMIEESLSGGLPANLSPFGKQRPGFYTGFSMAQETASALVSENKVLAHPASIDSIPGLQEDHVSMGAFAARKAAEILENVQYCLAIELLSAAQGLDLRSPLIGGVGSDAARAVVRQHISALMEDRELHNDLLKARELICEGTILSTVERAIGHSIQ